MSDDWEPGDRVTLVFTADPHTKLKPGDKGVVMSYDRNFRVLHVQWVSGSNLSMLLDAGDEVEKEEDEEPNPAAESLAEFRRWQADGHGNLALIAKGLAVAVELLLKERGDPS
jgi:Domain of unknown function (DUF4314)